MNEERICQDCGFLVDECICVERWTPLDQQLPPYETDYWLGKKEHVQLNRENWTSPDFLRLRSFKEKGWTHWMILREPQPPEAK